MKTFVTGKKMNPRLLILAAAAVLISVAVVIIPWQVKTSFNFDFDKPHSSAFVTDKPKAIKYNPVEINLPGAGSSGNNEYLFEFAVRGAVLENTSRMPEMTVTVNGVLLDTFSLNLDKQVKSYQLANESGNLLIELKIPRDPNVKLRYAKLYYTRIIPVYSSGIHLPPVDLLLKLSLSMLAVFAIPLIFKSNWKTGFIIFLFFSIFTLIILASSRLHMTIIAGDMFSVMIIMLLLSVMIRAAMQYIFNFDFAGHPESFYIKGFLLAIVFFLAFKLLFVLHPSLISLDIGYHTRNLKKVLSGDMNLITVYPGDIYKIPYPPLFYMLIAPFTLLTAKFRILLKLVFAVIEVASPVLLGLTARKLFGGMKYAFWAFLIYNLIPFSYRCISAGFIAEQFSQLLFLGLTLFIVSMKEYKPKHYIFLFLFIFALLMSHFGIVIKFYISIFAMLLLIKMLTKSGIPVRPIILIVILATAATYFVFYINYNEMLLEGVRKVLSNQSPIPEGMQKPLMQNFTAQFNYFGRYFFLPFLLSVLGIILFLKRIRTVERLNSEINLKPKAEIAGKTGKGGKDESVDEGKNKAVSLWLLLTYLIIFLTWWLTPLKVRHFNFSLIIMALFAAYFLGNISFKIKRFKAYLAVGLTAQIIYLAVILNRLVFYFYRAYIN